MNWFNTRNKSIAVVAVALFLVTGTYNAVVINSESHLAGTDLKFVKRLDEVYGVTISGRDVANSVSWQKLAPAQINHQRLINHRPIIQEVSVAHSSPEVQAMEEAPTEAAVQEELSLNLVEVINSKKWQNGLNNSQFNGSLTTNNGTIESLNVSLPNGEGVSVSFSEMSGNVFEYDLDGNVYSGMMYQVDQNSYMVTLSNGPLEGTRMRFIGEAQASEVQDAQQELAQNNVEAGSFGNDAEAYDKQVEAEEAIQTAQNHFQDAAIQAQDAPAGYISPEEQQADPQSYDQQLQQQAMVEQQNLNGEQLVQY